ncbi:MAG: hypothetical protein HON94_06560, partial [Methylococcales bacterium]|nr:hypothetical protein [Methylococcales bacterium]
IKQLIKKDRRLQLMGFRLVLRATNSLKPRQIKKQSIPLDDRYTKIAKSFLQRVNEVGSDSFKADYQELVKVIDSLHGQTVEQLKKTLKQ